MSHSQQPIVVVGSINIDLVAKAERIPVSGETVRGIEFKTHFGGKGANQAVAIARLGYPVRMIGKVGHDAFGEQLRSGLQQAGVDVSAVEQVDDSSGVAVIVVSPEGDNVIVVTPGANAALRPVDLDANVEVIRDAKVVLTQLETPMETVEYLAELCEREGVPLMLDPAPSQTLSPAVMRRAPGLLPMKRKRSFMQKAVRRSLRKQSRADCSTKE
jgi:ribokinase